jgi:signal peptidase I
MTRWARALAWGRQTVLTVGAVLGVVCLLLAAGSALFGLRPLVFRSGSMSPTIDTGALGLARQVDAARLEVGDVVSVPTGDGERVTHRIVRVTHRDETATLALRGDANEVPDARTYVVGSADRVLLDVPLLGYAVSWVVGPAGLFLLGLYAAFLLSVLLRPETPAPPRGGPGNDAGGDPGPGGEAEAATDPGPEATLDRATPGRGAVGRGAVGRGTAVVTLGVLVAGLAPMPITPTLAAWSDTATVGGSAFGVGLPAPSGPTCAAGRGKRTLFTWGVVGANAGASYVVHYGTGGVDTATIAAGAALSFETPDNRDTGTVWVEARQTFGGTVWTSPDSIHKGYTPAVC